MNNTESQLISRLRFPMTLAVVAQHCMGTALIEWETLDTKDIPGLVKTLVSGCAVQVAVPVFFFISGFLFFQGVTKMNRDIYHSKMIRRFHSLLIPYILWSLVAIPLLSLTKYGETLTGTTSISELYDFWHQLNLKSVFWSYQASTNQKVSSLPVKGATCYVDTSAFAPGVYIFRAIIGEQTRYLKIQL